MAKIMLGNHSAMRVPREEKDRIRRFYRDVLGCEVMREGDQKDDFRLGGDFYIAFMYEDEGVLDDEGFLKSTYLELKADDVEGLRKKIVGFGVTVLDVPDPHLYFQAPGGQVFRLVGVGEDLSQYEGTEHGEQFVGQAFGTRSLFEQCLFEQGARLDREHHAGDTGLLGGQEQHRVADVERYVRSFAGTIAGGTWPSSR